MSTLFNNRGGQMQPVCDSNGSIVVIPHVATSYFHTLAAYTAAQTKATVTAVIASVAYYVTDIFCHSDTSGSITIHDDATTTGAKLTIPLTANTIFSHNFTAPLKMTAGKCIAITSTMTNSSIMISGYTL